MARRDDQGKPPIELVPYEALEAAARGLHYGIQKYGKQNWRKGLHWSRLVAPVLRHLHKWASGEERDVESGLSHLDLAAASLAMLIGTVQSGPPELNDLEFGEDMFRYKDEGK